MSNEHGQGGDPLDDVPYAAMSETGGGGAALAANAAYDRECFNDPELYSSGGGTAVAADSRGGALASMARRTTTVFASMQGRLGEAGANINHRLDKARSTIARNGPLAWFVFTIGVLLELIEALVAVLAVSSFRGAWRVFVWSMFVRVIAFFLIASVVAPDLSTLTDTHCKLDPLALSALGSTVGYVYMTHFSTGDFEWRRAASIAYVCYIFFFLGYFRVMTKYFPMTRFQWLAYKCVRVIVIVIFLNTEILAQLNAIDDSVTDANQLTNQKRRAMQLISVGLTFNFVYDTCVRVMDAMEERKAENAAATSARGRATTITALELNAM